MRLVDKRLFIDAPPARVYELITDASLLVRWMAPVANVDPTAGGEITWTHASGDTVVGTFLELVPLGEWCSPTDGTVPTSAFPQDRPP
jgi:uncharacterized protein YndB with AHSA1/START domain